jgi:ABC-2 type transport system permease protein
VSAAVEQAPPLQQIKGPSATGTDWGRFWHLTLAIALTDFKLRFFGSALGYLWQLVRPLMLFGVLLVIFTQVVDLGEGVVLYAQALLLGLVLYQFFADATGASVRSMVERESLVRKVEFPRLAIPTATVLVALFNFAMNSIVVLIFLFAAGGKVRWTWLEMPLLIGMLAVLAMGLSMLLSVLFVRYRDIEPIWDVVLQILFYASAIFYPVQIIKGEHAETIVEILMINPFTAILQQSRHALIDPSHPSAAAAAGGSARLLIPIGISIVLIVLGGQIFRRRAPRIAEEL